LLLLERHIEEAIDNCPYLLERCVVAIVRAAIHMLPVSETLSLSKISSVSNRSDSGFPVVWDSLRILKGMPPEILYHLSDRVGAGMLTLLRGSLDCAMIKSMEQWYLIFSILSSVITGPAGRPYVWEAVGYLIDNNIINTMNFSPCRHLVLRFLHGIFPGGDVDTKKDRQQQLQRNPWITGSLMHLLRLTFMACGGYAMSTKTVQTHGSSEFVDSRDSHIEYCTFPYQDTDDFLLNSNAAEGQIVSQTAHHSVTVVCVRFLSNEDVHLLLLETVKSFSDFVNATPVAVSKQSLFCLRVRLSYHFVHDCA